MVWEFFTGVYDKIEYSVKLKDGSVRSYCWPNAGKFHDLESGDVVNGDDVLAIKPATKDFDELIRG